MEQSDLDLLRTVPLFHLQALIESNKLPVVLERKDEYELPYQELAQALFASTLVEAHLQGLERIERLILTELATCGGRANSRDLALYLMMNQQLNMPKPQGTAQTEIVRGRERGHGLETGRLPETVWQYPTPHPHGIFEQALHNLLALGLLFWGRQAQAGTRDYTSGGHDGVLILPHAVSELVKAAEEPQLSEAPEEELGEELRAFQRTLYLYWSLVAAQREGLSLLGSGLLSRPALRQVAEQLKLPGVQIEQLRSETEAPQLLFLRLLLMRLGLLRQRQGNLHSAPAEAFFALPLLERVQSCYRLWFETPFWNELGYLPDVVVRPGPTPFEQAHEEIVQSRHVVVEHLLQEMRSGIERDCSAFIAQLKLYAPHLLFPRHYGARAERYSVGSNPYSWDFRLRRGWLTHREGWYLVEGGFIKAIVQGPLQWLGLISSQGVGPHSTFRLNLGARLVMENSQVRAEEVEPAWGRLIIQPNFEIIALAPVSELTLVRLGRFAERVGLEYIAQYRLTRTSVTRAIQKGQRVEDIKQHLEQAAASNLPQNVAYSLVEWERQARRVELWRGMTLLEVDEAERLDRLYEIAALRPYLGRRLTPVLAEVQAHELAGVQKLLWELDYLPALSTATPRELDWPTASSVAQSTVGEPQWRLRTDGLLEPLYVIPDLYIQAALERITTLDTASGWRRLTPEALQKARADGLSLEEILHFLRQYCESGIPPSLLVRLKLWGGGYNEPRSVQIEVAPLLSLSAQALRDLQADEELGPLLGPELELQRRLVRIAPEHLERVVTILHERGFEVE